MEKSDRGILSDDIPLCKLNSKHIKNLFHDVGHSFPSETTCGKTVLQLTAHELQRMRNAVHDKQLFPVLDESTLSAIQYSCNLVGSIGTRHVIYLYERQPLLCALNSNGIAQALNDALRSLGINRSSFCLLWSAAAK